MKRTFRKRRELFLMGALGTLVIAGNVPSKAGTNAVSLDAFLRVLGKGDQVALQHYIERNFDPAELAKTPSDYQAPSAERADRLARTYVDTGGFVITRRIRSIPTKEVAVAAGKLTDLPYCLTLKSSTVRGRTLITDFTAVDLPLPASPAMGTPEPPEVAREMTRFMERLARADTFSGVFLIAKDGVPFVRKAYGWADLKNTPVNVKTRFNIASIGKSITAVVIAQLIDEGRISLDDRVGRILPDYPDRDVREKVSIRHLLTHTSGLGEKSEFTKNPLWPSRRMQLRSLADYIPLITGRPLVTEPGTQYSYSNAGFVILGLIIERVTGLGFQKAVAERVFLPAGMTHSFYDPRGQANTAQGLTNFVPVRDDYVFRLGPKRDATPDGVAGGGAHGGAYVTADDLLKFMTAVRAARLTRPNTALLLTTPQGGGRLEDTKNGFGFEIMYQNGHTIIGHGGGDLGVSAFVYHFHDTGYTAVVLSNYDPRAIRVIARKVRGLLTRSIRGSQTSLPASDCS